MAGARALWRATGMKDGDFEKPIIAVANSFTQFVPGHVHLKDLGQLVIGEIERAGGVGKEFNTIAVDEGIAMGHDGMLYSLPSRDIIADSVDRHLESNDVSPKAVAILNWYQNVVCLICSSTYASFSGEASRRLGCHALWLQVAWGVRIPWN